MHKTLLLRNRSVFAKVSAAFASAVAAACSTFMLVLADTGIVDKAMSMFNGFYGDMLKVARPVGLVAIAVCGFKWLFAADPQGSRMARTYLFSILGGLILMHVAPFIIQTIENLAA